MRTALSPGVPSAIRVPSGLQANLPIATASFSGSWSPPPGRDVQMPNKLHKAFFSDVQDLVKDDRGEVITVRGKGRPGQHPSDRDRAVGGFNYSRFLSRAFG